MSIPLSKEIIIFGDQTRLIINRSMSLSALMGVGLVPGRQIADCSIRKTKMLQLINQLGR
jgi:hypothetical protein